MVTTNLPCIRSITKLTAKDSHRVAFIRTGTMIGAVAPLASLTVVQDPDDSLPPAANAAHALIRPVDALNDVSVRQRLATLVKVGELFAYR